MSQLCAPQGSENSNRPLNCSTASVLIEHPPATAGNRRTPKWVWIVGLCFVVALTLGIVILATHWPFSRDAITRALQEATSRPVRIGGFRSTYFPPGCIAENVRVL